MINSYDIADAPVIEGKDCSIELGCNVKGEQKVGLRETESFNCFVGFSVPTGSVVQ